MTNYDCDKSFKVEVEEHYLLSTYVLQPLVSELE